MTDDILGLSGFYPKFVKKYANIKKDVEDAVSKYAKDVIKNKFPKNKTVIKMSEDTLNKEKKVYLYYS